MRAPFRFGNQLAAMVESADSPRVEMMADGVVMITRKWKVDSGRDLLLCPKPKDADPLGFHARCVSTTIEHGPGRMSVVTSTFQGYITLPPTIYEFANSRMDRPIQIHPKFLTIPGMGEEKYRTKDPVSGVFIKFWDQVEATDPQGSAKDAKFRGIEAYIVGSAQWRKTSYALQPDLDQTDVGKLSAPESGGYTGLPDANNSLKKWLKIEKTCRNMLKGASILWEITEVWQYNDLAWVTEIYGS